MDTITFMSFKGGGGKSTSIMLLVSVLVERGLRVGLIDADENQVLSTWRDYARDQQTWDDDRVMVWEVFEDDELEGAFREAGKADVDYLVVDTAGGGSDLNQSILINSDMVIVPTDLSTTELDEALKTFEYIHKLLKVADMGIPTGFLLNRTSVEDTKLATDEREGLEIIERFPMFMTRIPFNRAFKAMKGRGLLHLYRDDLRADPATRFRAFHADQALRVGYAFTDEMVKELKAAETAA